MKTRILHTKIWQDPWFRTLKPDEKLFFIYIITNEYINTLGLYELSDGIACLETGITPQRLQTIKARLVTDKKINTYNYYIQVSNSYKYQEYTGIKNNYQKLRLVFEMSDDALSYYKNFITQVMDQIADESKQHDVTDQKFLNLLIRVQKRLKTIPVYIGVSTGIDTGKNTEYRIQNTELRNKNTETIIEKKYGFDYLRNIPEEDIELFHKTYAVPKNDIKTLGEKLAFWCETEGETKKNYRTFLQNRLLDKFGHRPKVFVPENLAPEISEEQRQKNSQRIADIKQTLYKGMGHKMTDSEQNTRQQELMKQAERLN